jgi:hypothetical protein
VQIRIISGGSIMEELLRDGGGLRLHKLLEEMANQRGKTLDLITQIDANPEVITIGGRVVLQGDDARIILDTLRELCNREP